MASKKTELRYGEIGENPRRRSVELTIDRTGVRNKTHRTGCKTVSIQLSDPAGIGEMAVTEASNALCAESILPDSLRAAILLPPGTQEKVLRIMAERICRTCADLALKVEDIHAEVTNAVTRPVVTAACTGSQALTVEDNEPEEPAADDRNRRTAQLNPPNEHIVMTKWAGLEGTWLLAREMRDKLRKRFPERIMDTARSTRELMSIRREAEIAMRIFAAEYEGTSKAESAVGRAADREDSRTKCSRTTMVDLAEGGILAALWHLSERTGKGFTVDLPAIPLLQETIEITNYLGINPYEMRSAGSLLILTQDPDRLVNALEKENIPAAVIGKMTDTKDKLLINRDEKRYLDRPQADALTWILDSMRRQRERLQ